MNKDTVFYFSFSQDDDSEISKSFIIKNFDYELIENDDIDWIDQVNNMEEEYGVHDWGSGPNDNVNGIGYNTYEISEDKINEVMEKWRNYFISKGATVSKVVDLDISLDLDDYDIYKLVKEKL